LLDEVLLYKPELREFYDLCERVSGYYLADRYPPLGILDLTSEDVAGDAERAKRLIQSLFPQEELDDESAP